MPNNPDKIVVTDRDFTPERVRQIGDLIKDANRVNKRLGTMALVATWAVAIATIVLASASIVGMFRGGDRGRYEIEKIAEKQFRIFDTATGRFAITAREFIGVVDPWSGERKLVFEQREDTVELPFPQSAQPQGLPPLPEYKSPSAEGSDAPQ